MTRDESIHVIQFAASQLQTTNMRLSERLMQALKTLTESGDAEGTDAEYTAVGIAINDPCTVQMVIMTTPEDAGNGIEHAVKRILGRAKKIALPFNMRIDVKAYMKFAQIRARWTEEASVTQAKRVDQAPGNHGVRTGNCEQVTDE